MSSDAFDTRRVAAHSGNIAPRELLNDLDGDTARRIQNWTDHKKLLLVVEIKKLI